MHMNAKYIDHMDIKNIYIFLEVAVVPVRAPPFHALILFSMHHSSLSSCASHSSEWTVETQQQDDVVYCANAEAL